MQRVYDAGAASGGGGGGGGDMSAFWDVFQDYGNRTDYTYAFYGEGWTDETFNPKYTVKPTGKGANNMFWTSRVTTIDRTKVDFSQASAVQGACRVTTLKSADVDVENAASLTMTFATASKLESVIIRNLSPDCTLQGIFSGCSSLRDLQLSRSTIGSTLAVSDCVNLTSDSLFLGIIINLYNFANSGTTPYVQMGETNLAKLTDEQKAVATQKGWTLT